EASETDAEVDRAKPHSLPIPSAAGVRAGATGEREGAAQGELASRILDAARHAQRVTPARQPNEAQRRASSKNAFIIDLVARTEPECENARLGVGEHGSRN